MIGTRHEQAMLVVLAYVVGFVTAYIAFGMSNYETARVVYIESAVPAEPPVSVVQEALQGQAASAVLAQYADGMLTAKVGEESFVLSVDAAMMGDRVDMSDFTEQGLHDSTPQYTVSPDGRFIFFCEAYQSEGTCRPFMYSVEENVIRHVTFDGQQAEILNEIATTATWNFNLLQIGDYASTGADTSWTLATIQ